MNPASSPPEPPACIKPTGRVADLLKLGQSLWLDSISQHLMESGELNTLIGTVGIRGITSNPTIFEKAINGSADYDQDIARLASAGTAPSDIIRILMVRDVQKACDFFRPIYDSSEADDGYVSIEVNPLLAHKTQESIDEARKLHRMVDRPNVFIKIPGTPEGIPAIRALIASGISVNVTLLFSPASYTDAAQAYIDGIGEWIAGGGNPATVRSVASLFISRLDSLIDKELASIAGKPGDKAGSEQASRLMGKAGIANTQIIYETFRELFQSGRFLSLKTMGARVQRPLWASTGTKNPAYSDVLYLDSLIAPETVNTVPMETLKAFADHGTPQLTLERYLSDRSLPQPREILNHLSRLGVSLEQAYAQLSREGVASFNGSFESLLDSISRKTGAGKNP